MQNEASLIARAKAGDRAAFDALMQPHSSCLRSFLHRLVAHPQDAADLAQEATLLAYRKLGEFRGESSFRTWLLSIGSHLGLTHLRSRKRWAARTQLDMHDICHDDERFVSDMGAEVGRPDLRYEVAEHVAYCFSCIGRALDPEECAAVLLTEVFELPNSEAARALGLSESTFRHRLSSGRKQMMTAFDGLCALVSKRGACHQCATLRDIYPSERRGHEVPALGDVDDPAEDPEARFKRRLAIVRSADVTDGSTAGVHAVMLRFIAQKLEAP